METTTDPQRPDLGPDEDIVRRILDGESALYEVIVRRHNRRLFRAARAIVGDDVDAEDVVQEAYVRAFAALGQFRAEARFSTWLTRIAVHEALGRKRKNQRFESLDDDSEAMMSDLPPPLTPEQNASDTELAGWLERAVDALPQAFRTVFVLRTVEDMSVAETAECLSIPADTVKTRLFRARAILQRTLFQEAEGSRAGVYGFLGPRCDQMTVKVMDRLFGVGTKPS